MGESPLCRRVFSAREVDGLSLSLVLALSLSLLRSPSSIGRFKYLYIYTASIRRAIVCYTFKIFTAVG